MNHYNQNSVIRDKKYFVKLEKAYSKTMYVYYRNLWFKLHTFCISEISFVRPNKEKQHKDKQKLAIIVKQKKNNLSV